MMIVPLSFNEGTLAHNSFRQLCIYMAKLHQEAERFFCGSFIMLFLPLCTTLLLHLALFLEEGTEIIIFL